MSWAHVQGADNTNLSTTTTLATSFAATVGNGNLVCGRVEWGGGTLTDMTSVTDDAGNTYNLITAMSDGTLWSVRGFWLANITNAPKTITIHLATSRLATNIIVTIDEFSGGGASATIDKSNTNVQVSPGTGTDVITSGSVITTSSGELIYSVSGSSTNNAPIYSSGTGYTQLEQLASLGGGNPTSEFKVQTNAGAISATYTDNSGTDDSITTIMTFSGAVVVADTLLGAICL